MKEIKCIKVKLKQTDLIKINWIKEIKTKLIKLN